ncbi:MAG: SIS domain-containing protein [Elusimicrobia bacterium]|nr:SIS domain-containing protein [Elusimicrobiota bacterium]
MKNLITNFIKQTERALLNIESADAKGKCFELSDAVNKSFGLIKSAAKKGGKVILIGNGGSAAIASHIAVDLWKNGGVRAMAFNDASLLTCLANDLGVENIFTACVNMFAERGDVLIAISSSGKSENILRACKAAKKIACSVITMSGFGADNPLRKMGEFNFFVPARGYGYAETLHTFLCHALVDCAIEDRKNR